MAGNDLPEHDIARGLWRKIYAGYLTGRRINSLTLEAEAWFWRIHSIADDFGNLQGDPLILRSLASPRRDMTNEAVVSLTAQLVAVKLVTRYEVDGEPYLHIDGFEQRQAPANGRPKHRYPPPAQEPTQTNANQNEPKVTNATRPEQTRTDQTRQRPSPTPEPDGGGGEIEAWAERMAKRPDWLPDGREWIRFDVWKRIAREHPDLTDTTFAAILKQAKTSRRTLDNPAGFIIAKIKEATDTADAAKLSGMAFKIKQEE